MGERVAYGFRLRGLIKEFFGDCAKKEVVKLEHGGRRCLPGKDVGEVCRAHRSVEGGNRELVVLLALIGSVERIVREWGPSPARRPWRFSVRLSSWRCSLKC